LKYNKIIRISQFILLSSLMLSGCSGERKTGHETTSDHEPVTIVLTSRKNCTK